MPKKRLPQPPSEDWKAIQEQFHKQHGFNYNRKSRFFVDESLGSVTSAVLRHWGHNVKDVYEAGIDGQPDENVFQYARRDRRIVLTHDDDFWDNAMFPLAQVAQIVANFAPKRGGDRRISRFFRSEIGVKSM